MLPEAHVFIATSLDGYIATLEGDIGWLTSLPFPPGEDHGYTAFMSRVGAILMGRVTFEKAMHFDPWPYRVPVVVLSRKLTEADLPPELEGQVRIWDCDPASALMRLGAQGVGRVYVDGGRLISSCLREGLIGRMTVTRVPVLLGRGIPLWRDCGAHALAHVETRVWAHGFVQSVYDRTEPQVAM
jgi:dihydrofolate reductase